MVENDPLEVPQVMQAVYDEITAITDEFCAAHLNPQYVVYAQMMTAVLAWQIPSPLLKRSAKSWAAGILYTLGLVNLLFDKTQIPYMSAKQLCRNLGVSYKTTLSRAHQIRDLLGIYIVLDFRWCFLPLINEPIVALVMDDETQAEFEHYVSGDLQDKAQGKGLIQVIHASDS
jgi:hypothetical protein